MDVVVNYSIEIKYALYLSYTLTHYLGLFQFQELPVIAEDGHKSKQNLDLVLLPVSVIYLFVKAYFHLK